MRNQSREENILPPLERSKIEFESKGTSRSVNLSGYKFKNIETAVWANTAKDLIKKNQISELDIKLNTDLKEDKNNSTEYLITLRKAYDEMVKKSLKREKQGKKLREEIDEMKRQIQICTRESQAGRREVSGLQKNFEMMKIKQQTSAMAGKTLQHILARMKKDELTNQIKISFLQKRAKELEAAMSESEHKKYQLNEFEALSSIAAKEVRGSYIQCSQKRRKDMDQYESLITKKKQSDRKEEQRRKVTDQIQAIAASDLNDSNLLKWKKLLMVQLVLKKILKFKTNNIEAKYGDVKNAFHTIKINTTIEDPKSLAVGYFKFEDTYLTLLENVKSLEERQKQLQGQKQQFEEQLERLNNQYNSISNAEDKPNEPETEVSSLFKSTKQTSERSFQIRLIKQKIYAWVLENKWKLEQAKQKAPLDKRKYSQSCNKESLQQHITEYFSNLVEFATQMQKATQNEPETMFQELKSLEVIYNKTVPTQNQEQYLDVDEYIKTTKKIIKL